MQVPDKNASMESLVSTLILSGILPVLTLAASLCTNHSLYYQGYTNLPNSLHIDLGGCFRRLQLESIMSMCVHQLDIFLSKLSSAMTDWWIGVLADTPGGGGGREEVGVKWKSWKNKVFSQFSGYTLTLFLSLTWVFVISLCAIDVD